MSETEVLAEVEETRHHPQHSRPGDKPYPRTIYAWYVVGVLVVAYTFSLDRC